MPTHISSGAASCVGSAPVVRRSLGAQSPNSRAVKTCAATTGRAALSQSVKDARASMAADPQLGVFVDALQGKNMSVADFAEEGQQVNLLTMESDPFAEDSLPKVYDPAAISAYWDVRPVSVVSRVLQLLSISGTFISGLLWDTARGRLAETEVLRAIQIRDIVTSLGPAYIKLGQALSIRPDLLSPAAMKELQKLCDKVPSYPNDQAMALIESELGMPWHKAFATLSPDPIAAASLGQVYRGTLHTGEDVAVKVQRPGVLETVTVDLYVLRQVGMVLRKFKGIPTDFVDLLDEWAARFFEELDYVREGTNATIFAEQMREDLPQVVVPTTYFELTSRRVLTAQWLDGEKLSQSQADDVGRLVNIGVICYLKQLLQTGFFHADPHPGNLIRTPDGRLAILDFGLMTQIDDDIKFGMIEAISHLIHRDYEGIVKDFVTLQFIPEGTDLTPILPVLARVFDTALEGGGAKNINFQELAADLAQITFDYPFRIPPYFALIIRAISTLEGIALVGDSDFAIVDEAFPYVAQRLLTDDTPRLRAALKYMVYGKSGVFDADRLIDLLDAFETFSVNSKSALGEMQLPPPGAAARAAPGQTSDPQQAPAGAWPLPSFLLPGLPGFPPGGNPGLDLLATGLTTGLAALFPPPLPPAAGVSAFRDDFPANSGLSPVGGLTPVGLPQGGGLSQDLQRASLPLDLGTPYGTTEVPVVYAPGASTVGGASSSYASTASPEQPGSRAALLFMLSDEGDFFREFFMDEIVRSIDALSRDQLRLLVTSLGLENIVLPVLLPAANKSSISLAPEVTPEDTQQVESVMKLMSFLSGSTSTMSIQSLLTGNDVLPLLPRVASQIVPEVLARLTSRIGARFIREFYLE